MRWHPPCWRSLRGASPRTEFALREVWREDFSSWPFLDADIAKIQEEAGSEANYAGIHQNRLGVRLVERCPHRLATLICQGASCAAHRLTLLAPSVKVSR